MIGRTHLTYPKSTMVEKLEYDEDNCTLTVTYKENGKVAQYADVPLNKWKELIASKSVGTYIATQIKDKHAWTYTQAGAEQVA
jgi:hypothetical protein